MKWLLVLMLVAGTARGQVPVDEAQRRLEEKQRTSAVHPLESENVKLRREVAGLKQQIATISQQLAELTTKHESTIAELLKARTKLDDLTKPPVEPIFKVGMTLDEAKEKVRGKGVLKLAYSNIDKTERYEWGEMKTQAGYIPPRAPRITESRAARGVQPPHIEPPVEFVRQITFTVQFGKVVEVVDHRKN